MDVECRSRDHGKRKILRERKIEIRGYHLIMDVIPLGEHFLRFLLRPLAWKMNEVSKCGDFRGSFSNPFKR